MSDSPLPADAPASEELVVRRDTGAGQSKTDASQPARLTRGALIDRQRPLSFTFDGKIYGGFQGDTLASALLANGVRLVGRSFKYHRPRGIVAAGCEEPNALVRVGRGGRMTPNTKATTVELYPGLVAKSQNRWPSLRVDLGSVNGLLAPFFPAGFYYKTFMWPAWAWPYYEYFIRRIAGLGPPPRTADPDRYTSRSLHVDVLVVGGGPAGLAAAVAAAERGQRVALLDENPQFGGWLRYARADDAEATVDGTPGMAWISAVLERLENCENALLLPRTTAFGHYDHGWLGAVEQVQDHLPAVDPHLPRQRLWRIRARSTVLATGAIEQPLVFPDNDRPGVMLAGAVRAYLNGYGVLPSRRTVVLANNDDAYRTAADLLAAGGEVAAVLDLRPDPTGPLVDAVRDRGVPVWGAAGIVGIRGAMGVRAVEAQTLDGRRREVFAADGVAMSAGWAPAVHLASQAGAKLRHLPTTGSFVPQRPPPEAGWWAVGAAAGHQTLAACVADGRRAGEGGLPLPLAMGLEAEGPAPRRQVPNAPRRHKKCFLDFQNDVTSDDVELAHLEGYRSVEHLKRYTTLGMATDQGKTSNLAGLTQLAELRDRPVAEVGTTRFRPPYTPVALGVLAGQHVGTHFKPLRRTPLDAWHQAAGALWIDAGLWRRPQAYPAPGEDLAAACHREVVATRRQVGLCDVTSLGRIDIQGPDAAEFLNRVYVNGWKSLAVGRVRYGVMLREDGVVFDDGTTARWGEHHYLMTTTTAHAAPVLAHLEYYLQTQWSTLRVQVTSATEQWGAMAIAGPLARRVLETVVDIDVGNAALPFMAAAPCRVAGVPCRLFRISFSGELGYELNVPADRAVAVWEALLEAGAPHGITPYGTEALGTMRIEKGHPAGPELNGQTTLGDLGLAGMASRKKAFIGRTLMDREGLTRADRQQLVGLLPVDGQSTISAGSQLVAESNPVPPVVSQGHVTSSAFSPSLDSPIALGLLARGRERHGETLTAAFPLKGKNVPVKVVAPCFIDPEGARVRG